MAYGNGTQDASGITSQQRVKYKHQQPANDQIHSHQHSHNSPVLQQQQHLNSHQLNHQQHQQTMTAGQQQTIAKTNESQGSVYHSFYNNASHIQIHSLQQYIGTDGSHCLRTQHYYPHAYANVGT